MSHRIPCALLLAIALLGVRAGDRPARADDAAAMDAYGPAELKVLVGPIALYPDLVIAPLLAATTFPQQLQEAAALLAKQGGAAAEVPPGVTWDSSVQAMLQYPDLLVWLDGNRDWVAQMAFAVSRQQSDVLAAIQAFRAEAQSAGNLKSDTHQVVTTQDAPGGDTEVIVIQPADPTVVYVPTYSPTAVVQPGYAWAWGAGFAMGVAGAWAFHEIGWGSHGGDINVSRNNTINVNTGNVNVGNNVGIRGGNNYVGNNVGNDIGPNRPAKWNPSNVPTQRPAGAVAQPPQGGWGAATGAPKGGGVKPRPPTPTTMPAPGTRPGTPGAPGVGAGAGARPGTPSTMPARPSTMPTARPPAPSAARPTAPPAARPAPRPTPSPGGFGGATDGPSARATSDRGGASLRSSGGGASGSTFRGQSGRSGGGGGGRRGGGGGGGRRR